VSSVKCRASKKTSLSVGVAPVAPPFICRPRHVESWMKWSGRHEKDQLVQKGYGRRAVKKRIDANS